MKLGVFSVILGDLKLDRALDYLASLDVAAVEIGTGAYPGHAHCPMEVLLGSSRKASEYLDKFTSRGLTISSLSCHGNPLHPQKKRAAADDAVFRQTVRLATELGVDVVTTFSGCPGSHAGDKYPNWVTCSWPPDYQQVLNYQWDKVALPYWRKATEFAGKNGVKKIALEMHPGFLVYHPESLLKLREAVGSVVGANFDPSHLFWQRIDPCAAVRALQGAIFHVHAKDLAIHDWNADINGVLDTKPYREEMRRSWIFRTVGYGNSKLFWARFVSALRMAGYDGALSIEHEDSLMTPKEGLEKAVRLLQDVLLHEARGAVTWA